MTEIKHCFIVGDGERTFRVFALTSEKARAKAGMLGIKVNSIFRAMSLDCKYHGDDIELMLGGDKVEKYTGGVKC